MYGYALMGNPFISPLFSPVVAGVVLLECFAAVAHMLWPAPPPKPAAPADVCPPDTRAALAKALHRHQAGRWLPAAALVRRCVPALSDDLQDTIAQLLLPNMADLVRELFPINAEP